MVTRTKEERTGVGLNLASRSLRHLPIGKDGRRQRTQDIYSSQGELQDEFRGRPVRGSSSDGMGRLIDGVEETGSRVKRKISLVKNEGNAGVHSRASKDRPLRKFCRILADESHSLEDVWTFYHRHFRDKETNTLDDRILETLANRIIQVQHPTRLQFFRLLSVLSRLRQERLRAANYPLIRTKEWNALIHFAGNGLRKTTPEAYNAALDVYDDMLRHAKDESKDTNLNTLTDSAAVVFAEPDIYTYTTLLNIAVKCKHKPAIDHATNMLKAAQLEPTRITYLCTLPFRFREEGLLGIRSLMSTLIMRGHEVGIDGINAYITCAGKDGRVDIVKNLYKALRQNLLDQQEEEDTSACSVTYHRHEATDMDLVAQVTPVDFATKEDQNYVEGVFLSRALVPDEITYTVVVQTLAYSGHVLDAIEVLTDMLSTKRTPPDSGYFQPSYPVFRAFFLSYNKYALQMNKLPPGARLRYARHSGWTWERLQILLDAFFELEDCKPSARVIYWILMSVKWTTGNDEERMRTVWLKLKERFSFRTGGRLAKLDGWFGAPDQQWRTRWATASRRKLQSDSS